MDKEKTGILIKEMRIKKGMTQKQLADTVGVSNKAVSRWETGNSFPDVALLDKLAEALDLEIADLILGEKQECEDENPVLRALVQEAKRQKYTKTDKALDIISVLGKIAAITVLILISASGISFYLLQTEANVQEAVLTAAWGALAFGIFFLRFGLPLLGIAWSWRMLGQVELKSRFLKVIFILLFLVSVIWLLKNTWQLLVGLWNPYGRRIYYKIRSLL